MITTTPKRMGGVPCVRNTRIPVVTILKELAAREDPLKLHPLLTPRDVSDVLCYAAGALEHLISSSDLGFGLLGEVVYVRKGIVERGANRRRIVAGFSENGTHQPWMTRVEASRDAASRGMRAVFTDPLSCRCGSHDTTYEPDPYDQDLHGDSTRVWMCAKCRTLSADEL